MMRPLALKIGFIFAAALALLAATICAQDAAPADIKPSASLLRAK